MSAVSTATALAGAQAAQTQAAIAAQIAKQNQQATEGLIAGDQTGGRGRQTSRCQPPARHGRRGRRQRLDFFFQSFQRFRRVYVGQHGVVVDRHLAHHFRILAQQVLGAGIALDLRHPVEIVRAP